MKKEKGKRNKTSYELDAFVLLVPFLFLFILKSTVIRFNFNGPFTIWSVPLVVCTVHIINLMSNAMAHVVDERVYFCLVSSFFFDEIDTSAL